jgi:lipooligosaccharide transport system permease protein
MRMLTLPAITTTLVLNLAWIIALTAIFCIISINLMRKRLII